ncbi:MAG: alpha/beta hydrolase [Planctomycetes bacterium]|nr:alpha/beta hydrolase [Planctomycetota bacterium]
MVSAVLYAIGAILFVYWAVGMILYFMQSKFLYKPVKGVVYTPEELGIEFENVNLTADDGAETRGWYIPPQGNGYTILFCHGNGGNIMHRLDTINLLSEMGLGFFIFDYRGYGDSKGKTTEAGTYLDAGAAYRWLNNQKQIPEHRIVVFGRSLGASVAAYLAGKVNCGGVVLENAFTSYIAMGQRIYPYMPVKWFAKFKYDTKKYLESVSCPILFFHSKDDEVVPYEFGRELFESVECDKRFVDLFGKHNNSFLISLDIYKKGWVDFLGYLYGLHSKKD